MDILNWLHLLELIDTLWNVNEDDPDDDPEDDPELIDTLWNVNWFRIKLSLKSCCGINRYIMECKRQNIIVKNKLLKMFIILQKTKQEFSVVQLPR